MIKNMFQQFFDVFLHYTRIKVLKGGKEKTYTIKKMNDYILEADVQFNNPSAVVTMYSDSVGLANRKARG